MAKKLYIGNLPYTTTDAELKDMFAVAGAIESANVISDKMTGRSRGFGFVTMPNDEEALKAVDMFNGKDVGGRKLTVNEARPMTEKPPRRSFDRGGSF
jgi:RNA recognition motif-containing protein